MCLAHHAVDVGNEFLLQEGEDRYEKAHMAFSEGFFALSCTATTSGGLPWHFVLIHVKLLIASRFVSWISNNVVSGLPLVPSWSRGTI
jgi:hypothetical protein